jgi:hypothetical protein
MVTLLSLTDPPDETRLARLPHWAQDYIAQLRRDIDRERALAAGADKRRREAEDKLKAAYEDAARAEAADGHDTFLLLEDPKADDAPPPETVAARGLGRGVTVRFVNDRAQEFYEVHIEPDGALVVESLGQMVLRPTDPAQLIINGEDPR